MKGKGGTELVGPWGYFEVAEVAIMLGASERTIRRAIAAGKIDCYRISPRKSWISWADAEKWWAKRGVELRCPFDSAAWSTGII